MACQEWRVGGIRHWAGWNFGRLVEGLDLNGNCLIASHGMIDGLTVSLVEEVEWTSVGSGIDTTVFSRRTSSASGDILFSVWVDDGMLEAYRAEGNITDMLHIRQISVESLGDPNTRASQDCNGL